MPHWIAPPSLIHAGGGKETAASPACTSLFSIAAVDALTHVVADAVVDAQTHTAANATVTVWTTP